MTDQYIIALDQGTSSSRAILFDQTGAMVRVAQQEFTQHFPQPGWVEHDPLEIWQSQLGVLESVIQESDIEVRDILALGITNQRETTVVWNKNTGQPVYPAIVWQDKRTSQYCQQLIDQGKQTLIKQKTGLVIDAYFSASKIRWILDNVAGALEQAEQGELLFGTIDSWLIWQLSQGSIHVTDPSNASRTLLFNIESGQWDDELLTLFDIPKAMLPEVKDSNAHFADWQCNDVAIPIRGVLGDQQAALFGQLCLQPGDAKNTYGTGCFMLMNTGHKRVNSKRGLLTTIAWRIQGETSYALEGSVFIAGAAIQWLRDSLRIIESAKDTESMANSVEHDEVVVVPAFAGLGAPYWDMQARGAIFGLTRDTGPAELAKATLQSLALQSSDVLQAMCDDSDIQLKILKVDGGAIANDYLAQFQADVLQLIVERPEVLESTAVGAAYMAGIGTGLWSFDDLTDKRQVERSFTPDMDQQQRHSILRNWDKAIERTAGWLDR